MNAEWLNTLNTPTTLWILGGLFLLISEFAVPGLILFFFGLGAILTGIFCSFIDMSLNTQLSCFLIASIAMLLTLRGWLKPVLSPAREDDAPDIHEFEGETARVTMAIADKGTGRVELHGAEWAAVADAPIDEGADVVVVKRNNLTLTVQSTSRKGA